MTRGDASCSDAPSTAAIGPQIGPTEEAWAFEAAAGALWVVLTTILACVFTDVWSLVGAVSAVCALPLMIVLPPAMLLVAHTGTLRLEQRWCSGDPAGQVHTTMFVLGWIFTIAAVVVTAAALHQDEDPQRPWRI